MARIIWVQNKYREEHSVDQCRSRLKLSENFERHWSMLISGEIHMDQSLVHTSSWGNSYGPMVLKVFLKFLPILALVMDGSSQKCLSERGTQNILPADSALKNGRAFW